MEKKGKLFSYNVVFEPTATQEDILQFSGVKKLIEMAVEGFSCTAFCYGQTGSGKTHTLTGPPEMVSEEAFFVNLLHAIHRSYTGFFDKNRCFQKYLPGSVIIDIANKASN